MLKKVDKTGTKWIRDSLEGRLGYILVDKL